MIHLRKRRLDQQGFTLVELLVAMVLAAVLGSILMSITVSATRAASRQEDQTRTLTQAKVAMERVTREIRGANSMQAAAPRRLVLVRVEAGVRKTVTLEVVSAGSSTELRQTTTSRVISTGAESNSTATVLGGLAVGASDAVFTYADGDGTPLTPLTASPLTFAPGDVKTIGVRVLVRRKFNSPPVELYQLVSIRNLED